VLNTPNLPAVVDGMRQVCAMASVLLGNVSVANGPTSTMAPAPTSAATRLNSMSGVTPLSIGVVILVFVF
jgi:hypothetical protein